jgi:hypothetical protein
MANKESRSILCSDLSQGIAQIRIHWHRTIVARTRIFIYE